MLHAHAEEATSVKSWFTTLSDSGSTRSAKSDYHHFTGLTLFEILAVKIHCLGSVYVYYQKCRHYIRWLRLKKKVFLYFNLLK